MSLALSRSSSRRGGRPLAHARYGVDLANVPNTHIEPFTAYRAWNWTAEGVTSLNGEMWTPKQAFEAVCPHTERLRSMQAACSTPQATAFWSKQQHAVPDPHCTCGTYAGINMQHLIDINYMQRRIHGEVSLWGRLYRHTLGWRAQYAYPKFFVVPMDMVPFDMAEAQKRLAILTEFDVDIYLQTDKVVSLRSEKIPLWVKDYGYSQQALSLLVEKRKKWYAEHPLKHTLAVGDRVAVFDKLTGGGIGVVAEIDCDDMYYTMFSPNAIYHKKVKDVVWSERNWRWETSGLGSMRKIALGADRCRS